MNSKKTVKDVKSENDVKKKELEKPAETVTPSFSPPDLEVETVPGFVRLNVQIPSEEMSNLKIHALATGQSLKTIVLDAIQAQVPKYTPIKRCQD